MLFEFLVIKKCLKPVNTLKNKLNNKYFDIGYIDGANHSYYGKEDVLASEICGFLKEIYWQHQKNNVN